VQRVAEYNRSFGLRGHCAPQDGTTLSAAISAIDTLYKYVLREYVGYIVEKRFKT